MLTRKDFVRIGHAFASTNPEHDETPRTYDEKVLALGRKEQFARMVSAMCDAFHGINSRFDRAIFQDFVSGKCGPHGGSRRG